MLRQLLLEHLKSADSSWSCGRFGAIAEFHRDEGEPVEVNEGPTALSAITARGAIEVRDHGEFRPVAYETISKRADNWNHGVALCLPCDTARMSGRTTIAEVGPDRAALRPQDRDATLFDLGLGGTMAEICVRTADPVAIAALREVCGKELFGEGASVLRLLPSMSPHRVFISKIGRIEVYQSIPAPDGKSPEGPHTHVLKQLLERGRSHAATVPIPQGWVAGMTLYPPHPLQTGSGEPISFNATRHAAFQDLMARYGAPALVAGKAAAASRQKPQTREEAIGHRIGLRQQKWMSAS